MAQFIEVHKVVQGFSSLISINVDHIVSYEDQVILVSSYNGNDNLRATYYVTETYEEIKSLIEGRIPEETS